MQTNQTGRFMQSGDDSHMFIHNEIQNEHWTSVILPVTHQLLIHEHDTTSYHVSTHCCSVSMMTVLGILSKRGTVLGTVSQFYVALSTTFIRHRSRYRVRGVVQTVSFSYKPCVLVFKMHSSSIPKIHHHGTSWTKNLHPVPLSRELFFLNFLRGRQRHRDHLLSRIRNRTSMNSLKELNLWWATITRLCPQQLFFVCSSLPQSPFYLYFLSVCFSFSYTVLDLVFSLTILYLCVDCFNSIFLCWGPPGVFFFLHIFFF